MTDLLSREEFCQNEGNRCPFCHSTDLIDYDDITVDADGVYQEARCGECDGAWLNFYRIENAVLQYGPGYVPWTGSATLESEQPTIEGVAA